MTDHLFAGLVSTGHAVEIQYRRNGAVVANDVTAIRGRSRTERGTSEYVETLETVDWIVKSSDLGTEPAPDDRVSDGENVYKAVLDLDERCWNYVDTFETLVRIRTVLV